MPVVFSDGEEGNDSQAAECSYALPFSLSPDVIHFGNVRMDDVQEREVRVKMPQGGDAEVVSKTLHVRSDSPAFEIVMPEDFEHSRVFRVRLKPSSNAMRNGRLAGSLVVGADGQSFHRNLTSDAVIAGQLVAAPASLLLVKTNAGYSFDPTEFLVYQTGADHPPARTGDAPAGRRWRKRRQKEV